MLHGSYLPDDVRFLLKPIQIEETDIEQKERFIQNKEKHYSEMISKEYMPSDQYLEIFHETFRMNRHRMAQDLLHLARMIQERQAELGHRLTLVSLARAGTPVGVLLKRILRDFMRIECPHYSISIIRDRGIDENALQHIVKAEGDTSIVFIDGWTGKGVISRELKKWVAQFNEAQGTAISTDLYVLSDISGSADFSPSTEDYLIPSAILNATISGLVSRSILNEHYIGPTDFHGCRVYDEFRERDLSLWFVQEMMMTARSIHDLDSDLSIHITQQDRSTLRTQSETFIRSVMERYPIDSINHIKPGIAEATRVLLRRVPDRILVQNADLPEVRHLLQLAREKNVVVDTQPDMPYKAVGIIKKTGMMATGNESLN